MLSADPIAPAPDSPLWALSSDEGFEQWRALNNLTETEAIMALLDYCGSISVKDDPISSQLCLNRIIAFGQQRGILTRPKLTPTLLGVLMGVTAGVGVAVGYYIGKRKR